MKQFEFINDFYEEYEDEINQYVDRRMTEDKIQDKEGNYLENDKNINCYDEAIQFYGYEWLDKQLDKFRFRECGDYYEIVEGIVRQAEIDHRLIQKLLKWNFECESCKHKFTERELRYFISNEEDNQNCPACNYLIT